MSNLPGLVLGPHPMSTIKIYDGADEVRIEIAGRFQADSVNEVARMWRSALGETRARKCIVDISRISGYDTAGCKLLRDMYHHGTQIAAGTPLSLVFLNEISTPRRRGPALVRERPAPKETSANTSRLRPAAAGE
ncbi:MAG TPA: hypothetical protein VMF91_10415 [Bryobacteraceae bacterium]|nr:hypothetical protein [Bryobacteraceae bacterium]